MAKGKSNPGIGPQGSVADAMAGLAARRGKPVKAPKPLKVRKAK